MITLIEAKNYRCLQYIRQPLGPFHVLVGPNASGKTTFLDVVAFLGDLVSGGLDEAVGKRSSNYYDLIWGRQGDGFELAVEATIPAEFRTNIDDGFETVRYEIAFGVDKDSGEFLITRENLLRKHNELAFQEATAGATLSTQPMPKSILASKPPDSIHTIFARSPLKADLFIFAKGYEAQLDIFDDGPRTSLLGRLPNGGQLFDVTKWLKELLVHRVQTIILDSAILRQASRPGQGRGFKPDGSNLPWIVNSFRSKAMPSYQRWIAHLQTALPDLLDIETVERDDDRHRYIVLCYEGGLRVPSWMASDGTLRLIALTLIAYLPDIQGVYLIEEPENGIHPRAIETIFQSLSSFYEAQVLLATHSPVLLSVTDVSDVLCFSKSDDGAADIVPGNEHPALSNWHGETDLGVLFAGGVLG